MKLGTNDISSVYLGTNEVQKVYLGTNEVWIAFDPSIPAQEFYDRVTNAGGSLTSTEESAILTLITDLASYGLWTKMKAIYPMVGASSAACSQNLKSSSFTGTFTSGWTFASNGITTGGSAYMDTGLNASNNLSVTNAHLSVYVNVLNGSGDRINGTYSGIFIDQFTNTDVYYGIGNENGVKVTNQIGFFQLNALSTMNLFKNGSSLQSRTTGGNLPSRTLFLGASNSGSGGQYWWSGRMSFASIGDGLTDTEASNFYTAVQAFQTTLGRQV